MTTVIVGGGSLGLLLTDASMSIGERPYLLVRRKEQMQQLQQEGLTVVEEGRVRSVRHLFDVSTDWPKEVSRIIVATKFDAIQELLPRLERINAPTLFIQNGLAHYERIQKSHLKNVTFASIEHGAARLTDASVSHNGIGRLVFPKEASSHTWGDYMTSSVEHYPVVQVDEDALTILKRKVFMNVLINPLTAIYEIRNGVLVEEDIYYEKMYELYEELSSVFDEIKQLVPFETVVKLCKQTSNNHSSMYQDRQNQKKNEVATIVTPLINEAHRQGKELPLLEAYERQLHQLNIEGLR